MNLVIDASIAIKWVIDEPDSAEAVLLRRERLFAPELMIAECANVLWKKLRRNEVTPAEALLAGQLIAQSNTQLHSLPPLMERAQTLAAMLDHAAYDCFYLALAQLIDCEFVTADRGFFRKVCQIDDKRVRLLGAG